MKSTVLFVLLVTALFAYPSQAQEKADSTNKREYNEQGKVKEVDMFHGLLHPLVHEAYPHKDFATIRLAMPSLLKSGKTLQSATLPDELAPKKDAYAKQSKKLVKQLTDMNKKKMSDKTLAKKFMEMHDTFEEIAELVQ